MGPMGVIILIVPIMIHPIEMYVSNLKTSRKFYSFLLEALGYELFQEWEEGFSYKRQETYLVFVQVDAVYQDKGYHRKQVGLNHLAFAVENREQVDALKESLLKLGVTELYPERFPFAGGPDYYAFYCEDPDRIKLEITVK